MGFFDKLKKGQDKKEKKIEELDERQEGSKEVIINVGVSGVKQSFDDKSRLTEYDRIRSQITTEDIERIIHIAEKSETKNQLFTKVEDDGINLLMLVAMGVATEEAIDSYRTLRRRGFDTMKVRQDSVGIDEDYKNEVMMNSFDLPTLRNIEGEELPEPKKLSELFKESELMRYDLERKVKQLEQGITERSQQKQVVVEKDEIEEDIEQLIDITEDVVKLEEGLEEDMGIEESQVWESVFERLVREVEDTSKEQEKYDYIKNIKVRNQDKTKNVYILTDDESLDVSIDGYKVKLIREPNDLTLYTSSKDNLLILEKSIPRPLVRIFARWFKRLSDRGESYRIVTLKGREVMNSIVEEVVELTKESLDDYYRRYEKKKYQGSGVGTFFDIGEEIGIGDELKEGGESNG